MTSLSQASEESPGHNLIEQLALLAMFFLRGDL